MNNYKYLFILSFIVFFFVQCDPKSSSSSEKPTEVAEGETMPSHHMPVSAVGLSFEAPDQVPAGWVTIDFTNESEMVHFAVVERFPEGKTVEDQQKELAPVFQNIMDNINGKELSRPEAGLEAPAWFQEIVFFGGPGLLSPRKKSSTTIYLEPGYYVIECYVKSEGVFHSYNPAPEQMGMVHAFEVTPSDNQGEEPSPSLQVTVSEQGGIQLSGDATPGKHTIAVTYTDQKLYENFAGHDVHLVALNDTTNLDKLIVWMNWAQPGGLSTPAPAIFIGGCNEMPGGNTGYIHAELEPGRYALISEIPKPQEKGFYHEFTVSADHM